MTQELKAQILSFQRNEITESEIYENLAKVIRLPANQQVLRSIAADERAHYSFWKNLSGEDVLPDRFKVWKYYWISRLFGLTFGVKLMERGESAAQRNYAKVFDCVPGARAIAHDEDEHEKKLIRMIDEDALKYVGSIVLGLNDALVELTGALAGFTLALNNAKLVVAAGFITGISAALSMAASEYLSIKTEGDGRNPIKASLYTGLAYMLTVAFLLLPYFILSSLYLSLAWTLLNAVIVIAMFTFYTSVAQELPFRKRFVEMAGISLVVACISFLIGAGVDKFLHIRV